MPNSEALPEQPSTTVTERIVLSVKSFFGALLVYEYTVVFQRQTTLLESASSGFKSADRPHRAQFRKMLVGDSSCSNTQLPICFTIRISGTSAFLTVERSVTLPLPCQVACTTNFFISCLALS
ncbi:hypothetical protein Mapa_006435 [Marchantia paleacea]|nr:hypothetical protein Mapa_006435 [Marchantia paleacea]